MCSGFFASQVHCFLFTSFGGYISLLSKARVFPLKTANCCYKGKDNSFMVCLCVIRHFEVVRKTCRDGFVSQNLAKPGGGGGIGNGGP